MMLMVFKMSETLVKRMENNLFTLTEHPSNGMRYFKKHGEKRGISLTAKGSWDQIVNSIIDNYDLPQEEIAAAVKKDVTRTRNFFIVNYSDATVGLCFRNSNKILAYVPKKLAKDIVEYCNNNHISSFKSGTLHVNDLKKELNREFHLRLHVNRKKNVKSSEEQMKFVLDNSYNEKLQQELDEKDTRIIDLERKIDNLRNIVGSASAEDYALILMIKRWVKNFTCPLCGGSLRITHVKDKNGNRKQNVGRVAIGCTGYEYYSHSSCQSFRFANEWDYIFLHNEIEDYIHENPGTYIPREYVEFYEEFRNICHVFHKRLNE